MAHKGHFTPGVFLRADACSLRFHISPEPTTIHLLSGAASSGLAAALAATARKHVFQRSFASQLAN